jgi:hypothetical protein
MIIENEFRHSNIIVFTLHQRHDFRKGGWRTGLTELTEAEFQVQQRKTNNQ